MKNTTIMSLAVCAVLAFATTASAETFGRYLGVSYPDSGTGYVSHREDRASGITPAAMFGRYLGVTYVVPEQKFSDSDGIVARAEFKTIDKVAGSTITTITGTVKSVNVDKGFFVAEDKASGQEKLIHVPDAKLLAGLNVGENVSAVLPGTSCMALRIK